MAYELFGLGIQMLLGIRDCVTTILHTRLSGFRLYRSDKLRDCSQALRTPLTQVHI